MTTPNILSESEDWRDRPKSQPRTITSTERARLEGIVSRARGCWAELRVLEAQAYQITKEPDTKGYTSDLVLQSDVDVGVVLDYLGITVEDVPNG